jgi:hypothetical protein
MLFAHLVPLAFLIVQAGAAAGGNGSAARPYATIQAAANAARPGTAVLVRAGTYREAVKLPSRRGGTDAAPIWYVSADGPGRAKIVPPKGAKAAIQGLGVKDIAVIGFEVGGGQNGIQFGLSGDPRRNPRIWKDAGAFARRILVRGNVVHGQAPGDGIKISQADHVDIADNRISNVADQCVDFVAVNQGTITHNDCAGARHAAAIFTKAGSQDIVIANNAVHDVRTKNVAGIAMGGESSPAYFRPGQTDFEVQRITVRNNGVERVAGYPLAVQGAHDARATGNFLDTTKTHAAAAIGIAHGSTRPALLLPRNVTITGNTIAGRGPVWVSDKRRRPDGSLYIDLDRDHIRIGDNHRGAVPRDLATGPRPFRLWAGAAPAAPKWLKLRQ